MNTKENILNSIKQSFSSSKTLLAIVITVIVLTVLYLLDLVSEKSNNRLYKVSREVVNFNLINSVSLLPELNLYEPV